jgi:hypothetical protein
MQDRKSEPSEPLLKGRLGTIDLLVLTYLDQQAFDNADISYFLTKQASLMRKSTVLVPYSQHSILFVTY